MNYRSLGKSGLKVSEISLGTWQVGGRWGSGFDHQKAENILNSAIDRGVNFIDTADVYENGLSETAVGKVVRSRSEQLYVATKCGRQIQPHENQGYTVKALQEYVEDSLRRTGLERLDLIQLHCPPWEVYYRPEIFELFDRLKQQGKIAHLGVSVERVEEALKAIEFANVTTVQIIFNLFRQRPADLFFQQAREKNIGIIARVPLASGLLTGKFSSGTQFEEGDHRHFNRDGEYFDKGETFSGIPYQIGLEAVEQLKELFLEESNLAPRAIQWILQFPEVSCVIPGASSVEQVIANVEISHLSPLTDEQVSAMNRIYGSRIKPLVHHLW